jgi:hypothetical protein
MRSTVNKIKNGIVGTVCKYNFYVPGYHKNGSNILGRAGFLILGKTDIFEMTPCDFSSSAPSEPDYFETYQNNSHTNKTRTFGTDTTRSKVLKWDL